jgi:hypothetical protein
MSGDAKAGLTQSETFTAARAIAIHVAGHAVTARIIRGPFTDTRIVDDAAAYGELDHALPEWTRPASGGALGKVTLTKRLMVCLSGTLTEAAWLSGAVSVPRVAGEVAALGAAQDELAARSVAARATGSPAVTDAYIESVRQQVMNRTGTAYFPRPIAGDNILEHPMVLRRRFWLLVNGLADAAARTGGMSWAKKRTLLNQLERDDLDAMLKNVNANRG